MAKFFIIHAHLDIVTSVKDCYQTRQLTNIRKIFRVSNMDTKSLGFNRISY